MKLMILRVFVILLMVAGAAGQAYAAGDRLYGVHWWDYDRPNVGSGPTGGWSVETVLTNSDPWQEGWWFEPLYRQLAQAHQAEVITRVDYTWKGGNITVPAPTTMPAHDWANKIVSDIIGPLGPYASRWIIGNEPNLLHEANGWPENKITPAGYAQIYHTVRQVIKSQRPNDEVLFAPVSPGGVFGGVRWKAGNEWLAEAIDATLALGGGIDGFAIHAYGNPWVGAEQAVAEFANDYRSQINVIDARGLRDVPLYVTEWNRRTSAEGNLAVNEQVSADFLRLSLLNVDAWNRVPGNHNIRAMGWFVYNDDGGWREYALEWWRSQGNPAGHPGDLWTALMNSSGLQAGMAGTRPIADYNSDDVVDHHDYVAWRNNFGRTNWIYTDGNRNGMVDAADYVLWRKSTTGGGSSTVAVPEVSTLSMVLSMLIGGAWRRGRR